MIWSTEEIPTEWDVLPLSKLTSKVGSGATPRGGASTYAKSGTPLIRSQNVRFEGFSHDGLAFLNESQAQQLDNVKVEGGDVLLNITGASIGRVSLAPEDMGGGRVNQHVCIIRPNDQVLPSFLAAYLSAPQIQDSIASGNYGVTREALTKSQVLEIPVPVPDLPEQEAIVSLLESLRSKRLSALVHIGAAHRVIERFRQSLLAAARSGRLTADWREQHLDVESADRAIERRRDQLREQLGRRYKEPRLPDPTELPEIPETWAWVALPELGELGRGKSKHRPRNAPHLYGGPYPFIQTGDVARSGGKITSHTQTYSEAGLSQSRLWPAKTVCITIAANIADTAMLTYSACFPDSVVGLVADESIARPEYVEFFIRTIRDNLETFAPATAQANINLAILGEVAVALPPVDEQVEIVRRVELALDQVSKVEASITASAQRLKRAGHATLAKAFRGELITAGAGEVGVEPAAEGKH